MSVGNGFKSHGLLGSMVDPDWPALRLEEVNRVLLRYPQARGALRLLSRSPRPFSAASVVESRLGNVFVKRHASSVRDQEGLHEEHRFVNFLAASGAQQSENSEQLVQAVLETEDGETVVLEDKWSYEVHPVAKGYDVYQDALSWTPFLSAYHAYEAGRAMAKLHVAAASYDSPQRGTRPLVASFTIFSGGHDNAGAMDRMERYLENRPLLQRYAEDRQWRRSFDDLFLPRFAELTPWLASIKPLWTHNDFHASNLMWSKEGERAHVSSVIDFGLSDRTNAVHDLATVIERNIVEWLRIEDRSVGRSMYDLLHLDHLDELLRGYEELSPMTYEEAHGLTAMLPLVHCEFALSETDYFLSVLGSEDKAFLAYEGYFLAHAEWYKSAQGKQLLMHLKRWADSVDRKRAIGARL